jgi:hypothetical protein
MVATYGMNQMIIALGAAILIVADLIFVVFGPYGYSNIVWAVAAASLVLVLLRSWLPAAIAANYQTILVGLIGLGFLVFIRDVLLDISFIPGRNLDAQYFLGLLGIYAGVIIMTFGAWRMWRSMR